MSDDFFDFGFTAVNEEELESIQKLSSQSAETESKAHDLEQRLNTLHESILPLLQQLKQNPEKAYIHWPNRIEKVEQFEKYIAKIVKG